MDALLKQSSIFLRQTSISPCSVIIKADKAVNFGDGEGMQVPCKLRISGQEKFANILKKELERLEKSALCNCTVQRLTNSSA